jgi:hypothetical protein
LCAAVGRELVCITEKDLKQTVSSNVMSFITFRATKTNLLSTVKLKKNYLQVNHMRVKHIKDMTKFKVLFFGGTDATGKTTLVQAFNKATNYKYFCTERLLDGAFVYDKVYNRPSRDKKIFELEKQLINNTDADYYFVRLYYSDKNKLLKRLKDKKESKAVFKSIEFADLMYYLYSIRTNFEVIHIDTTKLSIAKSVKKIMEEIGHEQNTR